MTWDLSVILENKPGSMAAVCRALEDAGIGIEAICGFIESGIDVDHFLVDDPAAALSTIERTGSVVRSQREVVVVPLPDNDRPFSAITTAAADAGVNIDLIYVAIRNRLVLGGNGVERLRVLGVG